MIFHIQCFYNLQLRDRRKSVETQELIYNFNHQTDKFDGGPGTLAANEVTFFRLNEKSNNDYVDVSTDSHLSLSFLFIINVLI